MFSTDICWIPHNLSSQTDGHFITVIGPLTGANNERVKFLSCNVYQCLLHQQYDIHVLLYHISKRYAVKISMR